MDSVKGMLWVLLGPRLLAHAAASRAVPRLKAPTPVTISITHLPSATAAVKVNFYNSASSFLQSGQAARQQTVLPGGQHQVQVWVSLPACEWAMALSQDTNDNGKMDRNLLGIPNEPYAFSNNVRPRLGPPTFEDCKVQVTGQAQLITIQFPK